MTPNKRDRGPITNFNRFSMWAPVEGGKRAQLVFGIQDGNPRFTVFYPKRDPSDTRTPSITAAMGLDTCLAVLKTMEQFTKKASNSGTEVMIENTRNTYENGSSTPTGRSLSTVLIFGRNEEGVYYLQIKDAIYPKQDVKFTFMKSDWHVFKVMTPEGIKPIGASTMSQIMAEAQIEALRDLYVRVNIPATAGVSASLPDDGADTPVVATPKAAVAEKTNFDDITY